MIDSQERRKLTSERIDSKSDRKMLLMSRRSIDMRRSFKKFIFMSLLSKNECREIKQSTSNSRCFSEAKISDNLSKCEGLKYKIY